MDGLNLPAEDVDRRYRRSSKPAKTRRKPLGPRIRRRLPLFLCVVLPTALASVYYFGFAADQYVSEARFVVRGANASQPGLLSNLLDGVSRAQDDTFSVQEYILSRDALRELVDHDGLLELFSRPEADRLSRFPGPFGGESFEHLFKYYLRQVDVTYDSTTGVSELTVKAFRAADAQRIAAALLSAGEQLINRMNDRERTNTLSVARREVTSAEARISEVASKIAAFRNRELILDPDKQSAAMLTAIGDLDAKLTATRTQIAELSRASPDSPLIATAQRHAAVLQGQIKDAMAKVAGSNTSMVPKITEYDQLALERSFADRALASATASLESARVRAEQQELYLDPIVAPNQADYPLYPKRLMSIGVVFATCFGVYTAARLLIAGAREHRVI